VVSKVSILGRRISRQEEYGGFQWCGGGRIRTVVQRKPETSLSKDLAGQPAKILDTHFMLPVWLFSTIDQFLI